MGIFSKHRDPIAERERAIKAELAELREQIKRAEEGAPVPPAPPKLRTAARPDGPKAPTKQTLDVVRSGKTEVAPEATPAHFNELGVRKYDLLSAVQRLLNHLRGGPVQKSQVVTLLAAGSIQGLRPLRYEKRVARNRFLALFIVLLLVLFGLFVAFTRNR